jgi:PII-like signaling protein
VIEEGLKLTTYFSERDRGAERLVADDLLRLYGKREIHTSVLLRGIAGFGVSHRLQTDRLLSMSEDLPVASVAIDTRSRIEQLLPDVRALVRAGLLTVERAELLTGPIEPPPAPADPAAERKLTIYCGRRERIGGAPAFVAVCELLHARGISGATVLLGVDGTTHGVRARARFFARNADVPLMIVAVGRSDRVGAVLPELGSILSEPCLTLEGIRVCKRDGRLLAGPGADYPGAAWQKLMIHSSEAARFDGHPLHRALVQRLRVADVVGAISVRGIWGFHGAHEPHGDRLLSLRCHVPIVTIVIDTPERIGRAFEIVDAVTVRRGLVTSEPVPTALALAER